MISDALIRTANGNPDAIKEAAAATLGFTRSTQYMDTARSLMHQIVDEVEEIAWNMESYEAILGELRRQGQRTPSTAIQIQAAAKFNLGGKALSVHAELLRHFYALSLQHVWYFMLHSLRAIDPTYVPPQDATDYLDLIQAFRNHMEHRDKAAGNIASGDWMTMSKQDRYSVTVGYQRDHENNVSFVPTDRNNKPMHGVILQMPLNPDGFKKFEAMIITVYQHIGTKCLERLEQYFTANPGDLPALDQVGKTLTDTLEPVKAPAP